MPIIRKKSESDYTFRTAGYTPEQLLVARFHGVEAIFTPYVFYVDLTSSKTDIDIDVMVGEDGLLTIHGTEGQRYVHGMINRFEHIGQSMRFARYRIEIRPRLWILSFKTNLRIFQEKNVPGIIKKVLAEAGITGDRLRFSLKGDYETREYCVQYRETDLQFISRLMEEEGIFYFFEHDQDKHVMVIADDGMVHESITGNASLRYCPPQTTGKSTAEHITEFKFSKEIQTGLVRYRDFDFKKPRLNLETYSQGRENRDLERYDYPGRYVKTSLGRQRTRTKLEGFQALAQTGEGKSDCRRFLPGLGYDLTEHPYRKFNQKWLLTHVTHFGDQESALEPDARSVPGAVQSETHSGDAYTNQFVCIPADVCFRPLHRTPVPVVEGPQTAIVVGPQGEEIYTDRHGRVKVQFHWDREGKNDEKSSCWIRVSQGWAGQGWGMMFLPRIGQEVVVDFIEGDPDQPIITGRVYNGEKTPPYELPSEKTKSTIKSESSSGGGNNEIRFEDKKGAEEIYIHAQKDKDIRVENNRTASIEVDDDLTVVSGNRTIKIPQGTYDLSAVDVKVTARNSIQIVCGAGSISFDAAGNISINGVNISSIAGAINEIKGALVKLNS